MLNPVGEERSVRESRQRVVEGLVTKLRFSLHAFRDIEEIALQDGSTARRVCDHTGFVVHPDDISVPRDQAIFDAERLAGSVRQGMCREHALTVLGME